MCAERSDARCKVDTAQGEAVYQMSIWTSQTHEQDVCFNANTNDYQY